MAPYRLYVDDSGTKEYASSPSQYGPGNTRHFVFGAVLIDADEASRLSRTINRLERGHFGTSEVEVKSSWLRRPELAQEHYLEPLSLTEERLRQFVEEYYGLLMQADLLFLAAVVDKIHMREVYQDPWYAAAVAYEVLLQRAQNQLEGSAHRLSVTVDDMTGATPAGNQYKRNLARQHEAMKQRGSGLLSGFAFPNLAGRLRFVNSRFSNLIQVADIAAYNVHRQFREYGEQWEDHTLEDLPTYPYFSRILPKFRQGPDGRIQGYGVCKFPMRRRVPWGLTEEERGAAP